ncbi:MAG: hypothetical protein PHT69_11115 [Bacteroidales bacterium]|nr:hypothetical protein [Bacteroidales bacterium]
MKKIVLSHLFIIFSTFIFSQIPSHRLDKGNIRVQSFESRNRNHLDTVVPATDNLAPRQRQLPQSSDSRFNLISNYIPEHDDAIKIININFNIFQDYWGNNNFSPLINSYDSIRLMNMLNWVNQIYATQPICEGSNIYNSDPPQGVEVRDLDHKYIQFKLNNIYVYKDISENEGLWKSNNVGLMLQRIASEDSTRLNQLNIFFTEKYYMGSVRRINIINGGHHYAHPAIEIKGGGGHGAQAFANVADGNIKSITVVDGGTGFRTPPAIKITGGEGSGALAQAFINEETGRLLRIEVINPGTGYKHTNIIFRGGDGTGAEAYVQEIRRGKINSIVVTQRGNWYCEEPQVQVLTDSHGSGAELSAVVQGATGFTTTPQLRDADMYIVQKSLWNNGNTEGDYASATNIAHELGHVLGLLHIYNQVSETRDTSQKDYLYDVFGLPFSAYHIINWGLNPCASANDLVTNNLMGGNQVSQYTSPLQIGKMHRALHTYNVKKYASCTCDTSSFWIIDQDEVWNFDIKFYKGIKVVNSSTLTINGHIEMPDACSIIVENGSQLIIGETGLITGGCHKLWNGYLQIRNEGHFIVRPGGKYLLEDLGKFRLE